MGCRIVGFPKRPIDWQPKSTSCFGDGWIRINSSSASMTLAGYWTMREIERRDDVRCWAKRKTYTHIELFRF